MAEDEQPERRQSLLTYLERHWRELSLRDANSLSIDCVDGVDMLPMIKETLTYS